MNSDIGKSPLCTCPRCGFQAGIPGLPCASCGNIVRPGAMITKKFVVQRMLSRRLAAQSDEYIDFEKTDARQRTAIDLFPLFNDDPLTVTVTERMIDDPDKPFLEFEIVITLTGEFAE